MTTPHDAHPSPEYIATTQRAQAEARAWLMERGLMRPGETPGQYLPRLAEYRDQVSSKPPPSTAWADRALADWRAGKPLPQITVRLAAEALGLTQEDLDAMRVEAEI